MEEFREKKSFHFVQVRLESKITSLGMGEVKE